MTGAETGPISGITSVVGVLFQKTNGKVLLRVRAVENGHGAEAYIILRNWYGKQLDIGLAEFRQQVIRPVHSQKQEDTARCNEDWEAATIELRRVEPAYKELPDAYQSAALRGALAGKYKD